MSSAELPDFEHTLALAQGNLEATDLAECHGATCGLLCRMPDASLDALIGLLDMLELVKSPGSGLRMAFEDLLQAPGRSWRTSTWAFPCGCQTMTKCWRSEPWRWRNGAAGSWQASAAAAMAS